MSEFNTNKSELLQIADAVAREKLIEPQLVVEAMEDSLAKAAKSKYGSEYDIQAKIDPKTGELSMNRCRTVVDNVENHFIEILLKDAENIKPGIQIGELILDPLPPIDFGRIAAQSAKQTIVQKVREAERSRQYEEFKDRVGQIINGQVKRIEYGNVIVDVGRGEAVLRRDQLINRETFRNGDRVRAYIKDVKSEIRGPQIFLSRTAPEFLAELFKMEVPEIYDGIIEIKTVARDPGSRAKIGVLTTDNSIDPVGACVGMRGSRVQAVVNELQGEKIDIVNWSEDPAAVVANALSPAEVQRVNVDEEQKKLDVILTEENLSKAIGRRGQNVRLASDLSKWYIDVISESDESDKRQEEINERTKIFIEALDVDDVIAHLIVSEGYTSINDIADTSIDELNNIEGFEEELSIELKERAQNYVKLQNENVEKKLKSSGIDSKLYEFSHLSKFDILTLVENDIKTLDDLADLDSEELFILLGKKVFNNENEAGEIIMEARKHWFDEDYKK